MQIEEALESFPCEKCGKTFPYKYALKRHAKYCGDAVPKVCRNCQKVLKNHSSLLTHERRCLGVEKELPCVICKKIFRQTYNLRRHMRDCHGKEDIAVQKEYLNNQQAESANEIETKLDKDVSEEVYTLRFGTDFDENDISVHKLDPSEDVARNTIEDETDDDEKNDRCIVFQYEDSSEEECVLNEISTSLQRKTS